MDTYLYLFSILTAFQNVISTDYGEMLHVMKTFLVQRHIQTVTVETCWSLDLDKTLLKELSSVDVSVSFSPPTIIQQTHHVPWHRYAFIVDLSCNNNANNFEWISNNRLFNMQNDWILFGTNQMINETNTDLFALRTFEVYLSSAYILPDSGVFLFQEIDNNLWDIWNGFRTSKTDSLRVFKMGTASPDDLNLDFNVLKIERGNFRGITLKSTTVIVNKEYFFGFDKRISSDLDVFAHMHYEIINLLCDQLNFKLDLSVVDNYGWSLGNGSYDGLTGLLEKEIIEFSATGLFIRPDRMAVVDYTVGIVEVRSTVFFKQPPLSSAHNILLLPFTPDVWLVVWITFFVFVLKLVFLTSINNYFMSKKSNKNTFNTIEIITLVYGAVCQQGLNFKSNLVSVRVVISVLFITSLFVFTSYSASIVALLQSNSDSIRSIRDLAEMPMTFSIQISQYGKRYFEETKDSDIKKLYTTKVVPEGNKAFVKASAGIEKMRNEFHGFMVEVISAYKIISKEWQEEEKCSLDEIQLFNIPLLSIAVVKKSGHKDLFKQKLTQQMEVGLTKRIASHWIAPKPCGSSSKANKQYVSVSIREIYFALKLFGSGVCISLIIFTLEWMHYHALIYRQNKKKFRIVQLTRRVFFGNNIELH